MAIRGRIGKKRKPAEETLTETLQIRLTPAQKQALASIDPALIGGSVSVYLRNVITILIATASNTDKCNQTDGE